MLVSTYYSTSQLDTLRELSNIGAGNAATALSSILGEAVLISITELQLNENEIKELSLNDDIIFSCHPVLGKISGEIWVKFTQTDADHIVSLLEKETPLARNLILSEVSHILCGSYVTAWGNMFESPLDLLPPSLMTHSSALARSVETCVQLNLKNNLKIGTQELGCSIQFNLSETVLNHLLTQCHVA